MMTRPCMQESAVSEVISTVLVVAITVIIAAIVASLIFGFAWIPEFAANPVTAERTGDTITFTNHGGSMLDEASGIITCYIGNPSDEESVPLDNTVGATATYTGAMPSPVRVVVIYTLQDGTTQIILDKQI